MDIPNLFIFENFLKNMNIQKPGFGLFKFENFLKNMNIQKPLIAD